VNLIRFDPAKDSKATAVCKASRGRTFHITVKIIVKRGDWNLQD